MPDDPLLELFQTPVGGEVQGPTYLDELVFIGMENCKETDFFLHDDQSVGWMKLFPVDLSGIPEESRDR